MSYKTQIGTTIDQPVSYQEIKGYISSFDLLSRLLQLQKNSVLMRNQIVSIYNYYILNTVFNFENVIH